MTIGGKEEDEGIHVAANASLRPRNEADGRSSCSRDADDLWKQTEMNQEEVSSFSAFVRQREERENSSSNGRRGEKEEEAPHSRSEDKEESKEQGEGNGQGSAAIVSKEKVKRGGTNERARTDMGESERGEKRGDTTVRTFPSEETEEKPPSIMSGVARDQLTVTGGSNGCPLSSPSSPNEPRRRSVHFDTSPTTVVVTRLSSSGSRDEDDEDKDTRERYARRQSAPASAIRDGACRVSAADAEAAEVESGMSHTLKALDPELRRSLTKLCCTNLENPDEDLDVIRPKLLGRDELEIHRLKMQQQQQRKAAASIAHANALDGEQQQQPEEQQQQQHEAVAME